MLIIEQGNRLLTQRIYIFLSLICLVSVSGGYTNQTFADNTPPDVESTSPLHGATNVPFDPPISITFTEVIDQQSLQQMGIKITTQQQGASDDFQTPQFSLGELLDSGLATLSQSYPAGGKHQITLNTNFSLPAKAQISVELFLQSISDLWGNPLTAPTHRTYIFQTSAAPAVDAQSGTFYIDPTNGVDDSAVNGSESTPWKTVTYALTRVVGTSAQPSIINLKAGTYTADSGETFPVLLENHVSFFGQGSQTTLIDGQNTVTQLFKGQSVVGVTLSELALANTVGNMSNGDKGGALYLDGNSSVVLHQVQLFNHRDHLYGGAIYAVDTSLTLIQNRIFDNTAQGGGGIYLKGGGILAQGNHFTYNQTINVADDRDGGAILILGTDAGNPTNGSLEDNYFVGNSSVNDGGAIALWNAAIHLFHNRMEANHADKRGGAIFVKSNNSVAPQLRLNDIYANTADIDGNAVFNSNGNVSFSAPDNYWGGNPQFADLVANITYDPIVSDPFFADNLQIVALSDTKGVIVPSEKGYQLGGVLSDQIDSPLLMVEAKVVGSPQGLEAVSLWLNEVWQTNLSASNGGYQTTLDLSSIENGSHNLQLKGMDQNDQTLAGIQSPSLTIEIQNVTSPFQAGMLPGVEILSFDGMSLTEILVQYPNGWPVTTEFDFSLTLNGVNASEIDIMIGGQSARQMGWLTVEMVQANRSAAASTERTFIIRLDTTQLTGGNLQQISGLVSKPNGDISIPLPPLNIDHSWRDQQLELVIPATPSGSTAGMVLIPGGSFQMGDAKNESEGWMERSRPVHTVTLDAFYMDKAEVTVGQFKAFLADSGYNWGGSWNSVASYSPTDDQPMIYVDWYDATAYAAWAGKRLPTEAEWEKAARGGLQGKRYPWGDEITHDDANYDYNVGETTAAGSYAANGYGLYDMAGNVWEWCADWYDEDYYSNSPATNPPGPGSGSYRVLRGGSWSSPSYSLRVANRNDNLPNNRVNYLGFRCVSGS
ncbi:MAG: pectinesterase family protein, partial [Candidatus Poribacteria bacterium]|nr:pectinesterase family protein [Candidatus Poribacteria bacterium]